MRRLFRCLLAGSILVGFANLAAAGESQWPTTGKGASSARQQPASYLAVATYAANGLPSKGSVDRIAAWLSQQFGLPSVRRAPHFVKVPPSRLVALRLRGVPSDRTGAIVAQVADIVSVYDDEARTVYLPNGWTGATAADWSIVVHELIHHLQNEAGQRFGCPELREANAFAAQERWLQLFGTNLLAEFGLDGLTLLARTNCFY